jgi:hypothetical protein
VWNSPNSAASVAPGGFAWFSAIVNIDSPSVSDSRMNSWRVSLHGWPVALRKAMPACHSASVRRTSRAKSCRWVTRAVSTCFRRASGVAEML